MQEKAGAHYWNWPCPVYYGDTALRQLGDSLKSHKIYNPLIITDKDLATQPVISKIFSLLSKATIGASIFSDNNGLADESVVNQLGTIIARGHYDCLISVGGADVQNLGKMQRKIMHDQARAQAIQEDKVTLPLLLSIPTVLDSGNALSANIYIANSQRNTYLRYYHRDFIPDLVIADTKLIRRKKNLTYDCQLLALFIQALETWCNESFNPPADALSFYTLQQIVSYLKQPATTRDGKDLLAAGLVCSMAHEKPGGIVQHIALSSNLLYQIPYAQIAAIVMPYALLYYTHDDKHKIHDLADNLGLKNAFNGLIKPLLRLRKEMDIPSNLQKLFSDHNLDRKARQTIADHAANAVVQEGHYQQKTQKAVRAILTAAFEGKLPRR